MNDLFENPKIRIATGSSEERPDRPYNRQDGYFDRFSGRLFFTSDDMKWLSSEKFVEETGFSFGFSSGFRGSNADSIDPEKRSRIQRFDSDTGTLSDVESADLNDKREMQALIKSIARITIGS